MPATYQIAVEGSMLPMVMGGALPDCLTVIPGSSKPYLPLPGCHLIKVTDVMAPATLEGCIVELTLHAGQAPGAPRIVTVMARKVLERPGHGY